MENQTYVHLQSSHIQYLKIFLILMEIFLGFEKSYFGHKPQCSNTASLFYEVPDLEAVQ